jgi:hypothetical protein
LRVTPLLGARAYGAHGLAADYQLTVALAHHVAIGV